MDPYLVGFLAATGVAVVMFVYGAAQVRKSTDYLSYFLYKRDLRSGEYSYSFAAASTSLATVLYYFVFLGVPHGLFILWSPLTYLVGALFFAIVLLPRLASHGYLRDTTEQEKEPEAVGEILDARVTLGAYLAERYQSSAVAISVTIIASIGLLSILLIELFVGVTIFSIYMKPGYVDFALVFIALLVFCYTTLGGLYGVIKTDTFQLLLMLLASGVFLAWLVLRVGREGIPGAADFFPHPPPLSAGFLLPYPLLVNTLVVNFCLLPSLLRTWQMTAASSNVREARRGVMIGVGLTAALTLGFTLIGIWFFKSAFPQSGQADMSLNGILIILAEQGGLIGSYVVFPLFLSACLAALLSTADSALLPLVQILVRRRKKPGSIDWSRLSAAAVSVLLLTLTLVLYFVVFRVLKFDLMPWLFTIFSLVIIVAPAIIASIILPPHTLASKWMKGAALVSLWGGIVLAFVISYSGSKMNLLAVVQLNSPLATAFGVICMVVGFICAKVSDAKEHA